jgi:hypothetical protein
VAFDMHLVEMAKETMCFKQWRAFVLDYWENSKKMLSDIGF